jgi:hypothetical protein
MRAKLYCYSHSRANGERIYSYYSFLTSALDGVRNQRHATAALYPGGRNPVSIEQDAGWAPNLVWIDRLEEKPFTSAGNQTPFV